MRAAPLSAVTLVSAAVCLAALTGCTEKSDSEADAGRTIKVTAGDDACETSAKTTAAGKVVLDISSTGSKVTEVEILYPDGRIAAERENIGPSTSHKVTGELKAGSYEIACIPGMTGKGYRQPLKVTGENTAARDPEADKAVAAYRTYAQEQADATLPLVKVFTDAVRAGDLEAAKKAYAPSRLGWERTEPVAESFGDIDPLVDTRADGLEEGQKWTGWHRLEKSLWADKKITAEDKQLATQLLSDLTDWQNRVGTAVITPASMANGANDLLTEVATGKVTGEEDRYSHTDLVDFKGNIEGAEKAYELLKPTAAKSDQALTSELDAQFAKVDTLLDQYRPDATSYEFVSYDKVSTADRKKLSDAVNALAEPVSKLAAAVVK
ncbi:iron uptake system protein EfeO [Streptomyces sp. NBC_00102]|uniref:iron uptake system protein EfeO n=1 Tax=Streptomyces sp. NBC_00102 TaxID=2975652 RepID=UPI00224CC595|nr:iron uptake system protein EfeO [Streptomyces sp. NBC_00102]MCX5400706.1 cupredoxin domain-containing protein [Streptomyces sp. NBC_00102]